MPDRLDARLQETPSREFHDLIAKISAIEEFKGWWRGRGLPDPATLNRLRKRAVEDSAAASWRIGGGRGSEPAANSRWRGDRRGTLQEEREAAHVAGYAGVLQAMLEGYREMEFGPEIILQFHARMLRYSRTDQTDRGKYKAGPDTATSYLRRKMEPPALRAADPDLTPRAMAAATDWARTRLTAATFHPLLVTAGFILEILAIRPFAHGNGRVSRILSNFLLLKADYDFLQYASLEKVIADRWPDYYFALRHSQANAHLPRPDITPWLSVFLDTVRMQTRVLRGLVELRPDVGRLSGNQLRVLNLLERNKEVTNRVVRSELDLPKDTAKQVLNRLLALNLIQRAGAGRAVRYRKAPLQDGGAGAK